MLRAGCFSTRVHVGISSRQLSNRQDQMRILPSARAAPSPSAQSMTRAVTNSSNPFEISCCWLYDDVFYQHQLQKNCKQQPSYTCACHYIMHHIQSIIISSENMCISPCQTCAANNFYSCTSCISGTGSLSDSLCVSETTLGFQIVTTCLMILFIMPVLARKRCLVLVRVLDMIQIISYFKFIRAYNVQRQVWLYAGMRAWGTWSEGWQIISGDPGPPVWTTEEGNFDKLIRLASTWGLFLFLLLFLALLKILLSETEIKMRNFMRANFGNAMTYAFYFTLQDTSFFIAVSLTTSNFTSSNDTIVCFIVALVLSLIILIGMLYCFHRINFFDSEIKLFPYHYLFLLSADYDLFPTYNLTDIPSSSKQISKYSNIRLIDMIKKIAYSFLIVSFLNSSVDMSALDQVYSIFGFLLFFQIIWFVIFPFNLRLQWHQFIVMLLAEALTFYMLFAPWYVDSQIAHTIVLVCLFGLGLVSVILQYCLDVYKLVPVDLYDTGIKVVIEDTHLLQELAQRKREQEEMEKKLRKMEEQREREKKETTERKQSKRSSEKIIEKQTSKIQEEKHESEISLGENTLHQQQEYIPKIIENEAVEQDSMNSEEVAELYKIDELKRRKVYQWNKKKPFAYSNKLE